MYHLIWISLIVHILLVWVLHLPTFAHFPLLVFSHENAIFYHAWPLSLPHHSLLDSVPISVIFLLPSIPCPNSFTKNKFKCRQGKTALYVLPQERCGGRKKRQIRRGKKSNFLPKGFSYTCWGKIHEMIFDSLRFVLCCQRSSFCQGLDMLLCTGV